MEPNAPRAECLPDWSKIEQQAPGLSVHSVRKLGEGWNAVAYLVNEDLVFRCPKRADHWEELEREMALLEFLAGKLPVAIPRYLEARRDSDAAPFGFAIYKYLPGQRLRPSNLTAHHAQSLGDFLKALHSIRPGPDIAAMLPRDDERQIAIENLAEVERDLIARLSLVQVRALREVFEEYIGSCGQTGEPVILHADLSADHILGDERSVTGVIDFGDANWGDPDYDFMYLHVDFGWSFVEEVARRYGHPDLARLKRKVHYHGIVDQIDTILEDEGHSLPGQKDSAWSRLVGMLDD